MLPLDKEYKHNIQRDAASCHSDKVNFFFLLYGQMKKLTTYRSLLEWFWTTKFKKEKYSMQQINSTSLDLQQTKN